VPIVGLCDSAVIMAVVGDMLNAVSTFGPSLMSLFVDTDSTKKQTNGTTLNNVTTVHALFQNTRLRKISSLANGR